jgi:hypothetical protein
MKRNPAYFNFDGIGGDCTNFISQCLYNGGCLMNFTRDLGWYFLSADDRAAAWSGVEFLYNFLTTNKKPGRTVRNARYRTPGWGILFS